MKIVGKYFDAFLWKVLDIIGGGEGQWGGEERGGRIIMERVRM